jgi:hypothetical protein
MPITYTNRKGFTYVLNKGQTKTGRPRYYFAREAKDEPVEQLPAGYEIEESVNGVVSLVREQPRLILPEEIAAVEVAIKKHPKSGNYRLSVKHDKIIAYEMVEPDVDEMRELLSGFDQIPGLAERLQIERDRFTQFSQVLRFILEDAGGRIFRAERWCYYGDVDDWIYAGHSGKIDALAQKVVPVLGTEDFFQLY